MRRWACWSLLVAAAASAAQAQEPPLLEPPLVLPTPRPFVAAPFSSQPLIPTLPKDDRVKVAEPKQPSNPLVDLLKPTIAVRGRIEADAILASQSPLSIATIGNLQDSYGFRRVRLGAEGTIGDASRWVAEAELAGSSVRIRNVFIGLTALPGVRELRVGYFLEPFSLEGATSSSFLTFMERSPPYELEPGRNWGIAGYWWPDNQRAHFAIGLFRDQTSTDGQSSSDEGRWAVTSRLTGLPIYEPNGDEFRLLHLGAALSQRNPANGTVIFAPAPQSNLLSVEESPPSPFLPAVTIPANSQQLYNLQFARVVGPLSTQAEWYGTTIQQPNAGVVFLHGCYVDASYFLTGEHRGYDTTRGSFSRVAVRRPLIRSSDKCESGYGAVELAARFAVADFDSSNLPPADDGGSAAALIYQLTLGVNWYLNDYTRFMFNYTAVVSDAVGKPQVSANLFSTRLAIYW